MGLLWLQILSCFRKLLFNSLAEFPCLRKPLKIVALYKKIYS